MSLLRGVIDVEDCAQQASCVKAVCSQLEGAL